VVKRKIPSPRRESNPRTPIVQPVAQRYTDWAITALNEISVQCHCTQLCNERFASAMNEKDHKNAPGKWRTLSTFVFLVSDNRKALSDSDTTFVKNCRICSMCSLGFNLLCYFRARSNVLSFPG
jgi:hypothetical protein